MIRILLIDDDTGLVSLLSEYLTQDGFSVTTANDGGRGENEALARRYAIVALAVVMPPSNRLARLRRIPRQGPLPVLMLTARRHGSDRLTGLEIGADGY